MTDVVAPPARGMRTLAKNTAVYAIADLIAKGGAYLLIPVLTRAMGRDEYGSYALVVSIVPLLTLVASLGLGGAVTRLWFDLDESQRKRFHASAFLSLQMAALAIAAGLTLVAGPLFRAAFRGVDPSLFVFGVWTAFFLASATVPLAVLRAEERPQRFAVLSSAQFIAPAMGVIVAVIAGTGVHGVLWGHLAGSACVFALSVATMLPLSARPPAWSMLRPALALGLPVIPHLAAHWALNVADRVAINRTLGIAAVGLYTVGYQIAQGVSLIATALNNATVPSFYRAAQQDRREMLGRAWSPLLLVIGAFSLGAALFGEELVTLLAAPEYRASYRIIPWVALGYWLLAAYYFPVNALFYAKRVAAIPLATATAALLNYLLNIWLVPQRGLIAAAQNTAISYGVLLLIVLLAAHRVFPLPYRYGKAVLIGAIGAGVYAASTLLPHDAIGTVLKMPLLGIFCAAGFAVVRGDLSALRTPSVSPHISASGAPRVILAAATATQARTMVACAGALERAGLEPVFVSLDPVLGKSAGAGFRDAGVVWTDAPAVGGTLGIVLRGRPAARALVAGAAAVVVGNDFSPFERLLIEQARDAGAISVLVQDGAIALSGTQAGGGARSGSWLVNVSRKLLSKAGFPFEQRPYGTGGCDVVCVYGASTRDALIARGVPADRIAVTGQPRYDTIGDAPRTREIMLVTTQPFSRYGLATLERETETFAAMIDAALSESSLPVVIKLHPDTDAASRDALQSRFAGRARFQQTIPIESLYGQAAVLVTLSSTTALEAMLFHVPVVVVEAPGFPTTLPYAESGAVVAVGSPGDLAAAIREALRPDSVRDGTRAAFLSAHLAPLDGRAAERIAAAIASRARV